MSRGITLEMEACSQEERRRIGRFSANYQDYRDDERITALREWMAAWSLANDRAIRDSVPDLPELSGFRGGEVVEPLVTLGDLLGGDWPERIRAAIVSLDTDTPAPQDATDTFIANVRQVIADYRANSATATWIATVDLFESFKALSEERLTAIGFGKRLGAYKVESKVTKVAGKSLRVYLLDDLEDALA
jgi:putative DNA primase/helicase